MPFGWDDALMIGGGLLGAAGGLFGGGGSGGGTQRMNQTTTSSPWSGISPYLTGGTMPDGTTAAGIFPEAGRLYNTTGWTTAMQDVVNDQYNDTVNNRAIFQGSGGQNVGGDILKGQYDPRITAAAYIDGPGSITSTSVDPALARMGQGKLDPTNALSGFLTGDSVNPFVDQQSKSLTDLFTRNFKEQVLPDIRHDAIAGGQYGGSRGDLANALATSRLTTDLAPTIADLGLRSWESAENRKYGTATGLNDQAERVATGNANRALTAATTNASNLLDTQKFNTTTTLNNNAQEMQSAAQKVNNRGVGMDLLGQAQAMTDNYSGSLLRDLNIPNDYNWANLGRYAGIIQPSAELFKTTNTTGTSSGGGGSSQFANAIGGAATGLGIGRSLFGPGGTFGSGGSFPGNSPAYAYGAPYGGYYYGNGR